jgi:hypothetical protein
MQQPNLSEGVNSINFLLIYICRTVVMVLLVLRFELFLPMSSLSIVFAAQLIEGFFVPLNFNTRTFFCFDSACSTAASVIVLDDDCTHGRQILLFMSDLTNI